jgi:conjugal transfer ATP-binding protein TraC
MQFKKYIFNKKTKKDFLEIEKGKIDLNDEILPTYINLKNPKFFEIENKFYSGVIIYNYNKEYENIILKNLINSNLNINISIFYERQDSNKAIKELTYLIGNNNIEITENQNAQTELVAFSNNDAKYIRRQIQLENEELYFLYIYIVIYDKNIIELESNLNKLENILLSSGLNYKKSYFRQEQTFISCLPIFENNIDIKNVAKRNVLTSGIVSTYPFISSTIFDEKGIYIGNNIKNNSLVFIDRFNNQKYKNANICIFGTSGAGKSFFTKILILRSRLFGIEQFIIDPEREYINICKKLNGTLLKIGPASNTYINVLDIREESIEEDSHGYLSTKINKLIGFFNLIFGNMSEEEKSILEEKIVECYKLKNITFQDKSLYKFKNNKKIFKETKDMPILEDLYNVLKKDEKCKIFKIKLMPFVKGSLNFFNNYTNVNLNNNLIVADIYELGEENLKYGLFIFTDLFWDKIKKDRKTRKSIYLDEIWRLIGVTSNKEVASFIYKIFKTIRKYGGSSVAITQDVSDLFSLEKGIYGKSIINNSEIKLLFSLEEENIKTLSMYSNLTEKEKLEIKSLKRGECLMFVGENHIISKIEADEFEKNIVIEDKNDISNNSNK